MKGLTDEEVKYRVINNLVNDEKIRHSRSIKSIILSNVLTLFNFINIGLFVLVLTTGSFQNGLFIGIIFVNTIIAIIQEIKAKKILDELKISTQEKIKVKRNGKIKEILKEEIVIDDLLVLSIGDDVVVDCVIIDSKMCEVDESIVTGESKSIIKKKNDSLISGSVIISGECLAKVTSIGSNNYANELIRQASDIKTNSSYLKKSVNNILTFVTILIIPTMILLFISQYFYSNQSYNEAILATVAGVIGMIPEGLVLLTSIALTVGVIKVAKKKVIVQKLNGIESLSCVDVLCLDKTGTITDGSMKVIDVIKLNKEKDFNKIICSMIDNNPINATDIALHNYFKSKDNYKTITKLPFSSYRKYSASTFEKEGSYALGALEFLTSEKIEKYDKYLNKYILDGYRIVTLVHSKEEVTDEMPKKVEVLGFVILKDNLRSNAKETLEYFEKQGVNLKIISGDNPLTVSNIMKQIDFANYDKYIEGSSLPEDYRDLVKIVDNYVIYGRVTPYQKQMIIKALKEKNTVGMVGDGVNDILALKEADCGIALASGISAARSVSEIVLTTSDFGVMPDIVNEGRRVVNNIERVSSMYLIKTIYSFLLSVLCIILSHEYPFYPVQLSLIGAVCVGIPSFFLALEPNYKKVKKGFLVKVFANALPSGLCVFLNIFFLIMLCNILHSDFEQLRFVIVCLTGFINLRLLYNLSLPLNLIRKMLVVGCSIVFFILLIMFPNLFLIEDVNIVLIIIILLIAYADTYIIEYFEKIYDKIVSRRWRKKNEKVL